MIRGHIQSSIKRLDAHATLPGSVPSGGQQRGKLRVREDAPSKVSEDVDRLESALTQTAGTADQQSVDATPARRQLRLRRPGRCVRCGHELAAGERAVWDAATRTVTCLPCEAAMLESAAGVSAQREYERRHQRREQHAREKLGTVGVALAKISAEPQSTTSWRQGARGEQRTAARLAKHLQGHPVRLLHDRRVPGHGRANIDHLAIGPGGVTIIDSKTHHGKVRVDSIGGLFSKRRQRLLIAGRDQTKLIDGIERQMQAVRTALAHAGLQADIRGALCFPQPDGLPLLRHLVIREVLVQGPRAIAELARRPGSLTTEQTDELWRQLATLFPPA